MRSVERALPQGFEALLPFVEQWAITGSGNRADRRVHASDHDRQAFYTAAREQARQALDYLDQKQLSELDAPDSNLMNLMLSLAHVALAVEIQAELEASHARFAHYMRFTQTPAGA